MGDKSRFPFFIFWLLAGLVFLSCGDSKRLVVYADPWCGDYAQAVVDAFQNQEEECEVELRILSSEVIAQHLHFGQAVDVALLLDSSLLGEKRLRGNLAEEIPLAEAKLVRVERKGSLNPGVPGAGGLVVEASGRPVRRWTDRWLGKNEEKLLVGNFYKQTRDYLLRGWGGEGIVLASLAAEYPNVLEVKAQGPDLPGGFRACRFSDSINEDAAVKFLDFLASEKSIELLGDFHLIH